jgi:hypothetical protein
MPSKFQKRTVDVVYTAEELARPRESPLGPTNGDLQRGLEFGEDAYISAQRPCQRGLGTVSLLETFVLITELKVVGAPRGAVGLTARGRSARCAFQRRSGYFMRHLIFGRRKPPPNPHTTSAATIRAQPLRSSPFRIGR